MVTYICDKCGFNVNDKSRFERHLNRKYPCKSNIDYDNRNEVPPKTLHTPPDSLHTPPISLHTPPAFDCIYCGNIFKRKDNLTRHMTSRCRVLKMEIGLSNQKILELEEKINNIQSSNTNKTINSNNNSHNSNITQTNIINNFGNEDLSYLSSNKINTFIEAPFIAIQKMIEYLHFHPKHPENRNMKITNIKDPYIKVMANNKWKLENKKIIINNLIDKGKMLLDKYRDIDLHSEFKNLCYNNFTDRFDNTDKELFKNILSDVVLLIINKSDD